eukprot:13011-Pelagomonas_calceolata.AAC.3
MSFEAARGWVMKLFQWIESLSLSGKREMHCLLAPHIYVNSSLKAPRVFPTTRGQWASLQGMHECDAQIWGRGCTSLRRVKGNVQHEAEM